MRTLYSMKEAIVSSNESVHKLKESSLKNLGIERSMNQAIRFLDQDLSTYLEMTEQMINSIERIIEKSRFIIGDVLLTDSAVEH